MGVGKVINKGSASEVPGGSHARRLGRHSRFGEGGWGALARGQRQDEARDGGDDLGVEA